MNAEWIITNFVIMDDLMMHLDHHSHPLAQVPDSEILILAVVAPNTSPITMNAAWASCSNWAICRAESVYRGSIVGARPWPTGWPLCPRRWGRCGPRAKFLASTRCPCPCVGASERVVVARCVGGSTAAIARPSKRNSSVGVYSWSVPRRACRFPSSSCRGPCTI